MNRIEQMIHDLCPDGVKRVRLGEVCDLKRGSTITAKDAIAGDIPVIAGGQKPAYYHNVANRTGETITVAGSGAYAGFVAYWNQPIFVSDAFTVSPKDDGLMVKYVYYFLVNIQEKIHNTKKGSGVPHVHPSSIDNFTIPLPPLEIQGEIVKILDRFAVLTAELEAELETRRKQYEYYRTRLLSFDADADSNSVQWKALGEICSNCDNKRKPITSGKRTAGIYPYYGASGIVDYVEGYIFDGDYLLVSEDGANLVARHTPIAFSISGKNWVNNHAHVLQFNTYAERKFVEYYLNMIDLSKYISGGAQPKLNQQNLNIIEIPIPPLAEQERIVGILDRFDQLVNGVKDSLPELIDSVQKQYEYYRNKLLQFDYEIVMIGG